MGVAEDFERAIRAGGVVVFGADTVYGLACDPGDESAIARIYALKDRPPEKRSATMYFDPAALPDLPPRTGAAIRALVPGPLTFVVGELGLRVPDVPMLRGVGVPVLQTSANRSGGPDARRLADVPEEIRAGADLVLDAGELPGTPSTVVDLSDYEQTGEWRVLREGAVARAALAAVL
ncbi:MAG: L-threonylcarbamoyladenylate synthase [Solirubrobacteraceae bacterium]